MSVAWMAGVLGVVLAGEPASIAARPSPFVQVGLGGGAVLSLSRGYRQTMGGPTFAVEGGAVWNPLPRLRLGIGGALAQTGYASALTNTNTDLLAKLRLGVGTPRVWGYGIVGAGLSLVVRESGGDALYTDFRTGPAALAGLGVRGGVGRRVSLGLDVESTITGIPPIGRITRVSGLVVVEIRFGG